eukprot:1708651-Lingulodinium_polyedra.AAC.1
MPWPCRGHTVAILWPFHGRPMANRCQVMANSGQPVASLVPPRASGRKTPDRHMLVREMGAC